MQNHGQKSYFGYCVQTYTNLSDDVPILWWELYGI